MPRTTKQTASKDAPAYLRAEGGVDLLAAAEDLEGHLRRCRVRGEGVCAAPDLGEGACAEQAGLRGVDHFPPAVQAELCETG
eukprot:COSAG04_NODE_3746_length_2561_cov_4.391552_5_plen_82_part_00